MRIAYTTIYDATRIDDGFGSYNASAYYLGRAFSRAGAEMDYVGPLREPFAAYYFAKQQFHRKFTGKTYNRHRETPAVRNFSRQIARRLDGGHDVVFSPISPGSQPVAYLECRQPIIICSDSPLASAVENYPTLSWNASVRSNLKAGLANEQAALQRATLIFYPSKWAAEFSARHYRLDPSKVRVIPWGANLETTRSSDEVQQMISRRLRETLRILFIGMDWERKGGPTVVATVEELRRRGFPAILDIVGCSPFEPGQPIADFITVHGRLRRSDPKDIARFDELFGRAHFLMMPSRGEAFGHVFAEAGSFGVPSLATNIDGIPAAVRDGRNGRLFPSDATPSCYADAIAEIFVDQSKYQDLANASFNEFRRRLNWDLAAATMLQQIETVLTEQRK